MAKKIMVTTDFSEIGNTAIPFAFDLAAKTGASVILCNVIEREHHESQYFIDYTPLKSKKNAEKAGRIARRKLEELVPKKYKSKVKYKKISPIAKLAQDGILKAIDQNKPDLLVICSNGFSGFQKYIIGSTTDRVLRSEKCPVLVTRGQTKFM